jgi:hypothetical protein
MVLADPLHLYQAIVSPFDADAFRERQRGPSLDFRYALSGERAVGLLIRIAKPEYAAVIGTIRSVLFRCNEAEQYLATGIMQSNSDSPTSRPYSPLTRVAAGC